MNEAKHTHTHARAAFYVCKLFYGSMLPLIVCGVDV